jgi:zinc transport system ATP-binding protein
VVRAAIDAVGLSERAEAEVARLSGGQQRRVLIARALAGRPEVLVMDEPTAGVDAASQDALAEVLARLAADGTSMVVVTHAFETRHVRRALERVRDRIAHPRNAGELEALRDLVTRVVCMESGHVDFDGSTAEYTAHLAAHAIGSSHHHDPRHDRRPPERMLGPAPLDLAAEEGVHG